MHHSLLRCERRPHRASVAQRPDSLRYDWSHAALPCSEIDELTPVRGLLVCPASISRSNWSIVMMRSFFESDDKPGLMMF